MRAWPGLARALGSGTFGHVSTGSSRVFRRETHRLRPDVLPLGEAGRRVKHGTGEGTASHTTRVPPPLPALETRDGWVRLFPDLSWASLGVAERVHANGHERRVL